MKKIFFGRVFGIIFLLVIFLTSQNVFAEKNDYIDKSYNFKTVRKVALLNVSSSVNFSNKGNVFKQKLLSDYIDKSKKLKCEVITVNDSKNLEGADLFVKCNITNWQDSYYIVPEHTTWETKYKTRRIKNNHGEWIEERYSVTVPVTYPPRRVDVSDIAVTFEVYDTKTGKMVFGRDDVRRREDEQAQQGMYGRICNSFFEDLGKKIK